MACTISSDEEALESLLARRGDIVYSAETSSGARSCETRSEGLALRHRLSTCAARSKGPDPRFATSTTSGTRSVREWIVRHAHGATSRISTRLFWARVPSVPPLAEQRAIAHVLGALDDKIELNRRMSETLEAMARALFKSWFVDFDPVRARAEGRDSDLPGLLADLFPGRLVESELGAIPDGWGVCEFGDVVRNLRDREDPLQSPDAEFWHYSIPAFDDGQRPKVELGESIKSQKSLVPAGVVLLSKLNPEIERVWLVDVQPRERSVCSTEFLVLCPRSPFGRSYVYCLARSSGFRRGLESLVTGTSKSHQRAPVAAILGLPVVRPDEALIARFEKVGGPLLARAIACRRESSTVAAIRDALLPKLVSGELRVAEAEKLVGEVA